LIKIKGALIKKDLGLDRLAQVLEQDHALPQSFPAFLIASMRNCNRSSPFGRT